MINEIKNTIKKRKEFIELKQINFNVSHYKPKQNALKVGVGFVLFGFGVVTLPLPTGSPLFIGFGLMLLSPISLNNQLREKKNDLRFSINKRFVLWGLK